jgi:hypothetical protein
VAGLVLGSALWMTAAPKASITLGSVNQGGLTTGFAGQPYSAAFAAAVAWAGSFRGGGWNVIGAQGYAVAPAIVPGPVNSSAFLLINSGGSCGYTSLVPAGRMFSIPGVPGNRSMGNGSYWRVDMVNASGGVLSLLELGGQTIPLAVGSCGPSWASVFGAVSSGMVDSSVAALAAWAAGGDTFAAQYPNYTAEFAISGSFGGSGNATQGGGQPAQWYVGYTDCANSTMGQPVPVFTATVDAGTGVLVRAGDGSGYCPFSWVS